jgi:hypothetical protein
MQAPEDGDAVALRATLRVPAERLDAAVTTLRSWDGSSTKPGPARM